MGCGYQFGAKSLVTNINVELIWYLIRIVLQSNQPGGRTIFFGWDYGWARGIHGAASGSVAISRIHGFAAANEGVARLAIPLLPDACYSSHLLGSSVI